MLDNIVTLEECKIILKNYLNTDNFQIITHAIRPYFEDINGFLGEHLLLVIEAKVNEKLEAFRFFTKIIPQFHSMQGEYLKAIDGFGREVFVFEELLKKFRETIPNHKTDYVPQYLFGKPDVVVFEDLSLRNYDVPHKPSLNLIGLEDVLLIMQALAKYHSGTLAYEEIKSKQLGKPFKLFLGNELLVSEPLIRKDDAFLGYHWFKAGVNGLRELVDLQPESEFLPNFIFKEKILDLAETSLQLLEPQNKFRNVVCHGDLWAKNVMIKYDGDTPVHGMLIDFQLQRYHVPAHDVLLFIFLTTDQKMRQTHFHNLLRYYHEVLGNELRKAGLNPDSILPFDEFKKSVNYIMPEIKMQTGLQLLQQAGNKEFFKKLMADGPAFRRYVFQDSAPFALELFIDDTNFRNLLTVALEEIREIIAFPLITREDVYELLATSFENVEYQLEKFKLVSSPDYADFGYHELVVVLKFIEKVDIVKFIVKCELVGPKVIRKLSVLE